MKLSRSRICIALLLSAAMPMIGMMRMCGVANEIVKLASGDAHGWQAPGITEVPPDLTLRNASLFFRFVCLNELKVRTECLCKMPEALIASCGERGL